MAGVRYRSDFLLNDDGDLYFNPQTNDFDFGPSDRQHILDLLVWGPGWSKKYPNIGVLVMSYLKSKGAQQKLPQNIRLNLQADGYKINEERVNFKNFSVLDIVENASLL